MCVSPYGVWMWFYVTVFSTPYYEFSEVIKVCGRLCRVPACYVPQIYLIGWSILHLVRGFYLQNAVPDSVTFY